jgi:hypothetical protein
MPSDVPAPVVSAESLDAEGFDGVQLPLNIRRIRMLNMVIRVLTKNFPRLVERGTHVVLIEAIIIEEILWEQAEEKLDVYENMTTMQVRLQKAVKTRGEIIDEAKKINQASVAKQQAKQEEPKQATLPNSGKSRKKTVNPKKAPTPVPSEEAQAVEATQKIMENLSFRPEPSVPLDKSAEWKDSKEKKEMDAQIQQQADRILKKKAPEVPPAIIIKEFKPVKAAKEVDTTTAPEEGSSTLPLA